MTKGKLVIACGGGPTRVINHTLTAAASRAARSQDIKVFAAAHGVDGIVERKFYDLSQETPCNLRLVANTPGAAPGSTRTNPVKTTGMPEKILDVFRDLDVRYFLYIGGNDTALALKKLNDIAGDVGYEMAIIHVPKTVDNDLEGSDHVPGYPSAARYVASTFMGLDHDNESLPGILTTVIMGRDTGWLTAASTLGKKTERDGPHLVYLPERPQTVEGVLGDVDRVYHEFGRCLVAMSEGLRTPYKDGTISFSSALMKYLRDKYGVEINLGKLGDTILKQRDAFGNPQLSSFPLLPFLIQLALTEIYPRTRVQELGYPQRSYPGEVSLVDKREAGLVGRKAVEYALSGKHRNGSVALVRAPGETYAVETKVIPLEGVAGKTRTLPHIYIGEDGKSITPAFGNYATPFVGPLPQMGHLRDSVTL